MMTLSASMKNESEVTAETLTGDVDQMAVPENL
jgi:hypothetical protein